MQRGSKILTVHVHVYAVPASHPGLHEMWVTVVDPELPEYTGPSAELLRLQGGHQLRAVRTGEWQRISGHDYIQANKMSSS